MPPKNKFFKSEIDGDFKNMNKIIAHQIKSIKLKYGDAITLVKNDDDFCIGFILNHGSLDSGNK
ncbi:MAG: hypothetical protein JWP78_3727 [Mucilaginibacter sp.]|nr:hypothetical protein [Mucilaginibacter sp.]